MMAASMEPGIKKELPQLIRSNSLSAQVFNILKEAIFSGTFQPGEPLREIHLARMLEVSQATIREALVQLEQVGLVVREKNRRTTVASLSPDELRDRLTIRIALEQLALAAAAARLTVAELDELSRMAAAIGEAGAPHDPVQSALADMRFHHFVWERAGSPILLKTLDQLTTPLFAFLGPALRRPAGSHQLLVDALRGRDPGPIADRIRAHIEAGYAEFLPPEAQGGQTSTAGAVS
jgi:DNA-binding GntR family transcriptional regulator